MQELEIKSLIQKQRIFFYSGKTLHLDYRICALQKLKDWIKSHEIEINTALKADLGKNNTESYMCETGMVLDELSYQLKHLRFFTKSRTVHTPLAQFPAESMEKPVPYGVVLIMSPWNYPFNLTVTPLISALAAGNTAILKPSAYSPSTTALIKNLVEDCFSPEYVKVVDGGRNENSYLLLEKFDYIFFTGSQAVGKEVMKKAANHLTPVTLELGGKSPCIVDKTANLKLAAKRIVFGKFLNCGQTCVAPDYLYCEESIKDKLLEEIKKQIIRQYTKDPLSNTNYGKIINRKHFDRICHYINEDNTFYGGKSNLATLQIEPTILTNVSWEDCVMQEEIFGPILPVLTFNNTKEILERMQCLPKPLAFYLFSANKKKISFLTNRCDFGGGCINDTIIHLATSLMRFGGVGESGMGAYHGKAGFDTFSHYKSVVHKKTWLDLPIRYQPYHKLNDLLIHQFLK